MSAFSFWTTMKLVVCGEVFQAVDFAFQCKGDDVNDEENPATKDCEEHCHHHTKCVFAEETA